MLGVYAAVIVQEGRGLNKTFVLSLQQRFENYFIAAAGDRTEGGD